MEDESSNDNGQPEGVEPVTLALILVAVFVSPLIIAALACWKQRRQRTQIIKDE